MAKKSPTRQRRKDLRARVDVLRRAMGQAGMDDTAVAARAGVHPDTIENLLSGKYVRRTTARDVAAALKGHLLSDLFEVVDPTQPATSVSPTSDASRLDELYANVANLPSAYHDQSRCQEFAATISDRASAFVGRQWVFAAVDRFIAAHDRGYFVVSGLPGTGKTSLAAALTRRFGCPHYFNSRFTRLNRAEQFVVSICTQLVAAYGLPAQDYLRLRSPTQEQVRRIQEDITATRVSPKIVIVVDALDEVEGVEQSRSNPLSLPPLLSKGVYYILTTRPRDAMRVESPMEALALDSSSDHHLGDIRAFIDARLKSPEMARYMRHQGLKAADLRRELEERSQGNFMYLRYVMPSLESGVMAEASWKSLPIGLENYYQSHWTLLRDSDKQAWRDYKLPLIRKLAASYAPVTLALLAEQLPKVSPAVIADVLENDWRQFLEPVRLGLSSGRTLEGWRIYHPSFIDFLARKAGISEDGIDMEADKRAWLEHWASHGLKPD